MWKMLDSGAVVFCTAAPRAEICAWDWVKMKWENLSDDLCYFSCTCFNTSRTKECALLAAARTPSLESVGTSLQASPRNKWGSDDWERPWDRTAVFPLWSSACCPFTIYCAYREVWCRRLAETASAREESNASPLYGVPGLESVECLWDARSQSWKFGMLSVARIVTRTANDIQWWSFWNLDTVYWPCSSWKGVAWNQVTSASESKDSIPSRVLWGSGQRSVAIDWKADWSNHKLQSTTLNWTRWQCYEHCSRHAGDLYSTFSSAGEGEIGIGLAGMSGGWHMYCISWEAGWRFQAWKEAIVEVKITISDIAILLQPIHGYVCLSAVRQWPPFSWIAKVMTMTMTMRKTMTMTMTMMMTMTMTMMNVFTLYVIDSVISKGTMTLKSSDCDYSWAWTATESWFSSGPELFCL